MARPPAPITQADVQRAIRGAMKAGLVIGTVEVTSDGTVRITAAQDAVQVPVENSAPPRL
ncbi:MAG: hypothetical protein JJ902_18355 [Roseibium sp.]|nr:hypothetical protein [Roseibium sp.]